MKVIRDVSQALKLEEYKDGEVDWDKERRIYRIQAHVVWRRLIS